MSLYIYKMTMYYVKLNLDSKVLNISMNKNERTEHRNVCEEVKHEVIQYAYKEKRRVRTYRGR